MKKNHVFDVFIEVWKEDDKKEAKGTLIGQSRLTLYDARKKFISTLPIMNREYSQIGHIKLQAKVKHDKSAKKKAMKDVKK